jgi:hypothetical protein
MDTCNSNIYACYISGDTSFFNGTNLGYTGMYHIIKLNTDTNCSDITGCNWFYPAQDTTSIISIENSFGVVAYPNPFNSNVIIEAGKINGKWSLAGVYSVTGAKIPVQLVEKDNDRIEIDFGACPSGVYCALIKTEGTIISIKLIRK